VCHRRQGARPDAPGWYRTDTRRAPRWAVVFVAGAVERAGQCRAALGMRREPAATRASVGDLTLAWDFGEDGRIPGTAVRGFQPADVPASSGFGSGRSVVAFCGRLPRNGGRGVGLVPLDAAKVSGGLAGLRPVTRGAWAAAGSIQT
jgi:hypothetical protein